MAGIINDLDFDAVNVAFEGLMRRSGVRWTGASPRFTDMVGQIAGVNAAELIGAAPATSSVAVVLDNQTTQTSGTILSIRTGGAEKAKVAWDGAFFSGSGTFQALGTGASATIIGNITGADTVNSAVVIKNAVAVATGGDVLKIHTNLAGDNGVFVVHYDGGVGMGGNLVTQHILQADGKALAIFGGGRIRIYGNEANGAAAIGTVIDTNGVPYTTAGARLTSFQNNSVEKLAVGKNGQLHRPTGTADATLGTATLVGGTVTVSTTAVSAASKIFVSRNTPGGTPGHLSAPIASIVAATSFVINSTDGADTSTVNWTFEN